MSVGSKQHLCSIQQHGHLLASVTTCYKCGEHVLGAPQRLKPVQRMCHGFDIYGTPRAYPLHRKHEATYACRYMGERGEMGGIGGRRDMGVGFMEGREGVREGGVGEGGVGVGGR